MRCRTGWMAVAFALLYSRGDALAATGSSFGADGSCPAALAPAGQCMLDVADQGAGSGAERSTDPGAAPPTLLPSTSLGNPIDLVTGAKRQVEHDFLVPGSTLSFTRHYSSGSADQDIGLGGGWRHSYSTRLERLPDGGRLVIDATGRLVRFAPPSPDGVFAARISSDGHLRRSEERTIWALPDGRRLAFNGSFLIGVDWPDQRSLALHYRARRLDSITDETGASLQLEYTAGQRGLDSYDPDPYRAHSGYLSALLMPDGARLQYAYDERQNLTRATYPDTTSRLYHYEDPVFSSHLTGLTERTGRRARTWAYDERGRARLSERADGIRRVSLVIEAPEDLPAGRVGDEGRTVVTDSTGAISLYRWRRDPRTGASHMLSASGAGCASCPTTDRRYSYDSRGLLKEVAYQDERGTVPGTRRLDYDDMDRLIAVSESFAGEEGPVERWLERRTFDGDSRRVRVLARPSVNPAGEHVIETLHDERGLPISVTERGFAPRHEADPAEPTGFEPIERTSRLLFDDGRLVAIDGPRDDVDDVVHLDWDERQRLVAIDPPASPAMRVLRFDAYRRPLEFQVGTGRSIVHSYEDAGWLTVADENGRATRYRHDAEGRLLTVTTPDGRTREFQYDSAGRPVGMTDENGRSTHRTLDSEGRLVAASEFGADGEAIRAIEQHADALGRHSGSTLRLPNRESGGELLYRRRSSADSSTGATTASVLKPGLEMQHLLDPFGRLRTVLAPDGSLRRYVTDAHRDAPDPLAVIASIEDARGNITRYARDDFGRVVMEDAPDTGRVTHRHDAAGNRTESEDALGHSVSFTWDAANRLLRRTSADGDTTFEYDVASGLMTRAANGTTVEAFDHDHSGRLVSHARTFADRTFTTSYEWGDRSRLLAKTLPDGTRLRYRYHDSGPNRGELAVIERASLLGMIRTPLASDIDARSADGTSGYLALDGQRVSRRHAPDGSIETIDIGTSLGLRYRHDGAGRITVVVENGREQRYDFERGRLAEANTLTGLYGYDHDAAGNRIARRHVTRSGEIVHERLVHVPPGRGNRLVEAARYGGADGHEQVVTSAFTYDASGSLTHLQHGDGTRRLVHDADQQLVEVHENGKPIAEYGYNPFGERVFKRVHRIDGSSVGTWFLYDGTLVAGEVDDAGRMRRHYVYLDDTRPVAMLDYGEPYAIHTDHLGAPRLVTSADEQIVWSARYAPFGQATVAANTELTMNIRLPGQYADEETGYHYNTYRYYDPELGRYLTSDPIGLAGGLNTYAYADGDPVSKIDPLGLRASGLATVPIARPPIARPGTSPGRRPVVRSEGQVIRIDRYTRAEQAIRLYRPDWHPNLTPAGWTPDWPDVFDLEYELYRAQHDYAGLSQCDADFDASLWRDAVDAARTYENTWKPVVDEEPLPSATLEEIRKVYGAAHEDYLANGGTASFEEWLAEGMPDGDKGETRPTSVRYDPKREKHIFRDSPGHVNPSDEPAREQYVRLFERVASDNENIRTDAVQSGIVPSMAANAGVTAFTMVLPDDTQVWVTVRDGLILNAGINPAGSFR